MCPPPRTTIITPKRKDALKALLAVGEMELFSVGDPKKKLNLSKPALMILEVTAPNGITPLAYYLDGSDSSKTTAGISGTAEIEGENVEIKPGGTVIEATPSGDKTKYTIAILLDHFSSYVVGWTKNETASASDEGGSSGCFIKSLSL